MAYARTNDPAMNFNWLVMPNTCPHNPVIAAGVLFISADIFDVAPPSAPGKDPVTVDVPPAGGQVNAWLPAMVVAIEPEKPTVLGDTARGE
jgi:hypothetical protein